MLFIIRNGPLGSTSLAVGLFAPRAAPATLAESKCVQRKTDPGDPDRSHKWADSYQIKLTQERTPYLDIYIYKYVCMYIYIYIYMYVWCIYKYIYIYIYILLLSIYIHIIIIYYI